MALFDVPADGLLVKAYTIAPVVLTAQDDDLHVGPLEWFHPQGGQMLFDGVKGQRELQLPYSNRGGLAPGSILSTVPLFAGKSKTVQQWVVVTPANTPRTVQVDVA